jgi:superfamily I DNA/RNA helicase
MLDPKALCVVGDPHQAIYGWRGALPDSYDRLIARFGCTEYPLTVNWRCSRRVIEYAQNLVPEIQAHDNAPEGDITHNDFDPTQWRAGDALICRNNAPILGVALDMIFNHNRFPTIRAKAGSDDGFLGQLKKTYLSLTGSADSKLSQVNDLIAKARAKLTGNRLQYKLDLYDCLTKLIAHNPTTTQLDRMFTSEDPELVLTTGHRAKGLEFNNVFFLRPDLIPSKWSTAAEELQQEDNLHYVIATRAKQTLNIGPTSNE